MQAIPAIDLQAGQCVRLFQGDFSQSTIYSESPFETFNKWLQAGAERIHIIDLDGAQGQTNNDLVVEELISLKPQGVEIQLGGGIRSYERAEKLIDLGLDYAMIGTMVIKNPSEFKRIAHAYPNKIIVALDCKGDQVMVSGWAEGGLPIDTVLNDIKDLPLAGILFTDIEKDGTLKGASIQKGITLAGKTPHPVILAGGVATLQDITAAKESEVIAGVICGKALYENKFDLKQALEITAS